METPIQSNIKTDIPSYEVQQAIIAMEMKKEETAFLKYINFWQQQILTHQSLFFHALPVPNIFSAMYEAEAKMLISGFSLTGAIKKEMKKRVKKQVSKISSTKRSFEVTEGNPLKNLLYKVEEHQADLVIIGQHVDKDYHGIWAKKLAQKVPCNTLIIPDNVKTPKLKKILIPIDFSSITLEIIRKAIAIQKQLNGAVELVFLNVYEAFYSNYSYLQASIKAVDTLFKKDRELAFENYIRTYLPKNAPNVQMKLVEKSFSSVSKYINDYAKKEDFDLIIMGAKGHSKVEILLMGSVTEQVLDSINEVPILLIKEAKKGIW